MTTSTENIQTELYRIADALIDEKTTDKEYCELYAAQQALSWALDVNAAAAPFETIMNGRVQPLIRDVPMDNQTN